MTQQSKNTVGARIREVRKERKITLQELAEKLGVRHTTVSRYEKGIITIPSDKLKAIADILEVSPEYLLGWKDWVPGQINLLTEFGLIDYDYTVHPSKLTPRQRLLELINEAPDEKIDLLIDIAEAVIKGRKG